MRTSFTIIDEAIKELIVDKLKKLTSKEKKKIAAQKAREIVSKLGPKSQKLYDYILKGAKNIKPKSVKNTVVSFLEKRKVKNVVKYGISKVIGDRLTTIVGNAIDYKQFDCISSVSGFAAAIIDYGVDGELKSGKIYWG